MSGAFIRVCSVHGLYYLWQTINLSHFSPSLPLLLLLTLKKILKDTVLELSSPGSRILIDFILGVPFLGTKSACSELGLLFN